MVFRDPRTDTERRIDSVLLLYILDRASSVRASPGYVKPEKLAYLAQRATQETGIRALHYTFIKSRLGPFTAQIYDDIGNLVSIGAIREGTNTPTDLGRRILGGFSEIFGLNPKARKAIDRIVRSYAKHSMNALVRVVHEMKVPVGDKQVQIEDLPEGTPLLDPWNHNLEEIAFPSKDWEETLDVALSPGVLSQVALSEEDVKQGRVARFESKEEFLAHLDAL